MIAVMKVKEAHNNIRFLVTTGSNEYLALQLIRRVMGGLRANEDIKVGDLVLVCEVPHFLSSPLTGTPPEDSISHIILGIVPPSGVANIQAGLVAQ